VITFAAWIDGHYRTTAEVLSAFGDHLRWRLKIDDANSDADELYNPPGEMETARLLEFLDDVQIIDGVLEGRRFGDEAPYVIVRAVDSSWWDVESEHSELVDAARAKFPDAFDQPT